MSLSVVLTIGMLCFAKRSLGRRQLMPIFPLWRSTLSIFLKNLRNEVIHVKCHQIYWLREQNLLENRVCSALREGGGRRLDDHVPIFKGWPQRRWRGLFYKESVEKPRGNGTTYLWGDSAWTQEGHFSPWEESALGIISLGKCWLPNIGHFWDVAGPACLGRTFASKGATRWSLWSHKLGILWFYQLKFR